MKPPDRFSRRDFLKLAVVGIGGVAFRPGLAVPGSSRLAPPLPEFPDAERLARVAQGKQEIKRRPDPDSQTVGVVYEDYVLPWLRETVGEKPKYVFNNQRWVETPDGFIYAPYLQPVRNIPNKPITVLRSGSLGTGMWMEVTVPYADVGLERDPSSHSWVEARTEENQPVRVYYSQVFWVDKIQTDEQGRSYYHVNPNYYGGVDMFWVAAEALRPITEEDLAPIHPEVEGKQVVVDVLHQTLSCFEGETEVYYCRVSTGAKFDMYGNVVDKWSTPVGQHRISRKYVSLQMSGGTTGAGYDLPGIGWTSIFANGGVAIHSTFWHNNYGDPMSHGCVNTAPEDSRWVFRWTTPAVSYDPGMFDISLDRKSTTSIIVTEG